MHGGTCDLEITRTGAHRVDRGPWAVALNETAATDEITVSLLALAVVDRRLGRGGMMELSALLNEAETASPMRRIEWRDRIAAHGARAIEGVRPWLASPVLAAFAIRVIERAGTDGEATVAIQVLRSARSTVPPAEKGDIGWALQRLRLRSQPAPATAPPPTALPPIKPVRGERLQLSTVARRRAR